VEGLEGQLLFEGLALLEVAGVENHAGGVEIAEPLLRRFRRVARSRPTGGSAIRRQPSFPATPSPIDQRAKLGDVVRMRQVGQRRPSNSPKAIGAAARPRADIVDRAVGVDGHDEVGGVAYEPAETGLGLAAA